MNQSAPSGPAVIAVGLLLLVGSGYSVTVPVVVILPIWFAPYSVNHSAPWGPAAIPSGWLLAVGIAYVVICPAVVMRPISPDRW
ncbi:MAG TPA: hypothetical protein VMR62_27315 [Bryobacteraceae bacterium]|jgi:hypothetical protein|nr:hypothetical protein [Bryobacteraceae bacterium]